MGPGRQYLHLELRPKAKERPRVTRSGSHTYTPKATLAAQALIQGAWLEWHGRHLRTGPLALGCIFQYGKPPAIDIWLDDSSFNLGPLLADMLRHLTALGLHGSVDFVEGLADMDNLDKLVKDALQGVAFENDGQVTAEILLKVRVTPWSQKRSPRRSRTPTSSP